MRAQTAMQNPRFAYGLCIIYTVALAIIGLKFHLMSDGDSESDFFWAYVPQAQTFLRGAIEIDPYRGPVYPMLLGVGNTMLSPFGLGFFETGIVLSAISAGIVLLLTYDLMRRLCSPLFAMTVVLFVIANPMFVRYSYTAGNDMVFCALAAATVWSFLRHDETPRPRWIILVGVLCAVTYLARYNGVAIFMGILLCILLLTPWHMSWGRRFIATAVLLAAFIVTVAPWATYCKKSLGTAYYNHNYENVALTFYLPEGVSSERFMAEHRDEFKNIFDVVAYDLATFFIKLPSQIAAHAGNVLRRIATWPIAFLMLVGLASWVQRRPTRRLLCYYFVGLLFFLVLTLVFYKHRFNIFLIPILAALALTGITAIATVARRYSRAVTIVTAAAVFVFWNVLSVWYNTYQFKNSNRNLFIRQMGEWVTQTIPAPVRGRTVAARKPEFGYFAGLETVHLPLAASTGELAATLRERKIDYLFFSYVAARTRPELATLFDHQVEHPGLTLLLATGGAVLYAVNRSGPGGDG